MAANDAQNKKLAVVTGASSGIGLELAKQFAKNGFDLIIAAEDTGILAAAAEIGGDGVHVDPVQVDLSTFDGVESLSEHIRSSGRPVDAAAINAGIGVGGEFAETDLKAELKLINLNVVSTVHLTKRLLPGMLARRAGRILITSSIAGDASGPFEAVYAASKAFDLSFAHAIRNELKDSGITVTALQPGPTETNFFHRAGMDETKVGESEKDDAAEVAREGFEALMEGKDHVVAGSFKNKVFAAAGRMMPATSAEMHAKQAEPKKRRAKS
jgi:short-subunit dehydrogenase